MYLNKDERKMLDGSYGAVIEKAMMLLVNVGEAYEAQRMIGITRAHIMALEITEELFKLFSAMTKDVAVKVPTTVNPLPVDLERSQDLLLPEEMKQQMEKALSRLKLVHQRIGVIPTYTCHPHFMHELRLGEHISFTESNVVMLANAWFGARSNIEGATTAIASAITGKTAEYGLHLAGNRYGKALINVEKNVESEKFDYAHYNALAFWAGKRLGGCIPVYQGLSKNMTISHAKYMCAPQILNSCAAMFHILGVTPEASSFEAAFGGKKPKYTFTFGKKELLKSCEELCTAKEQKVDLVCLGCPHCTLEEIINIAQLLGGKQVSKSVRLWIGTNEPTKFLAKRMGLVDTIEDKGGLIVTEMCSGTVAAIKYGEAMGVRVIASNSGTLAGIVPSASRGKIGVWFGKTSDCISAAITGQWEGN
jgi:predicted aconitase